MDDGSDAQALLAALERTDAEEQAAAEDLLAELSLLRARTIPTQHTTQLESSSFSSVLDPPAKPHNNVELPRSLPLPLLSDTDAQALVAELATATSMRLRNSIFSAAVNGRAITCAQLAAVLAVMRMPEERLRSATLVKEQVCVTCFTALRMLIMKAMCHLRMYDERISYTDNL